MKTTVTDILLCDYTKFEVLKAGFIVDLKLMIKVVECKNLA